MYTTLISKKITELKNINNSVMKRVTIWEKNATEIVEKDFQNAIRSIMMSTPLNKNTNKNDKKISSGISESIELNNLLIKY